MLLTNNTLWDESIRNELLKEVENYLQLYLFKGSFIETKLKIEKLFNLNSKDLLYLKIIHFLLSDEVNELIEVLPFLMKNLSHSSLQENSEYRGIIKGKVNWNETLKTRFSRGFNDPTLFICSLSLKSYDLNENQLLKFLLNKIIKLIDEYFNFNSSIITKSSNNWDVNIKNNYTTIKKLLKNIYFEEISNISKVNSKILIKTQNNRNRHYKKVANVYKLYDKIFIHEDLDVLKSIIEKQLIKPLDDDTLFELYIFFKLIDYLPKPEVSLLRKGNDYYVKSRLEDTEIKIYYQNMPKEVFKENTKYKEIFKNYDINVNLRRPDIILEIIKNERKYYRIIEIKRTNSKDYIKDSVYKVFGYLHDFKNVNFTNKIPTAIICWDGIKFTDKNNAFNKDILILTKQEFLNNINKLFIL